MPQMSPLSWAPLMAVMALTLMLISATLHWAQNTPTTTDLKTEDGSKFNWKW